MTASSSPAPPPGCLTCPQRETWVTLGVARHRCQAGHPMQPGCPHQGAATLGHIHRAHPLDAAPWETSP